MFLKAGLACTLISLVSSILATVVPCWYYTSYKYSSSSGGAEYLPAQMTLGLWKYCHGVPIFHTLDSECTNWILLQDKNGRLAWVHVCQCLMVIGEISLFISCIGTVYCLIKPHTEVTYYHKLAPKVLAALSVFGGLCCLATSFVFVGWVTDLVKYILKRKYIERTTYVHVGMILSCLAAVYGILAGPILYRAKISKTERNISSGYSTFN